MTITTDDLIAKFGTQDEVTVAAAATVSDGAFSVAGDVNDWTNDDDVPAAMFVLVLNDLSGAPAAGLTVGLYCKPLNIVNTTDDHQGPNTNVETIQLGAFLIDAVDPGGANDAYAFGPVELPNFKTSQEYEFYIKNNLGVTIGVGTGDWELWVTPVAYGPHA